MNAHSASGMPLGISPQPDPQAFGSPFTCAVKRSNELSLITLQGGKDVLIDLSGIAEHDETYVAHIFLRSALDVGRRDRAQLLQKLE